MAGRPRKLDPESEAALSIVQAEKDSEAIKGGQILLEIAAKNERDKKIAECNQVIGRIQAVKMVGKLATVAELVWISDIKKSGLYRDLPEIGTWEKFCNSIGYSVRHIDDHLSNLDALGVDFLETVAELRVGYRDLRKLRQLTHDGSITIEAEAVEIGGDRIPFTPDHKEDLQAALDNILDKKNKEIEEARKNLDSKEGVVRQKQKKIDDHEETITKLEKNIETLRSIIPKEEEEFIRQLGNKYMEIYGHALMFRKEIIEGNAVPSPAAGIEVVNHLGAVMRTVTALYEAAYDHFGAPSVIAGEDWIPPHLRAPLSQK